LTNSIGGFSASVFPFSYSLGSVPNLSDAADWAVDGFNLFCSSILFYAFLGILKKHIINEPPIAKQLKIKKRVVFLPPYLRTRPPIRFPET